MYVGSSDEFYMYITRGRNQVRDGLVSFIIIAFLVVSCALVSKHRQMKRLLLLNERCIREQAEQYRRQGEEDTELRRFRHDYNAHIAAMQALAEDDDGTRLRNYVRELSELKSYRDCYNTGNLISDAILNRYEKACEENHIRLQVNGKFPDRIAITDTELCVIMSNGMKNAWEAALQCGQGKICFEIRNSGNFVNLIIRNSAVKPPELKDGIPVTTKGDAKNHGIGSRNMVETARRNGGDVRWEWDESGYVTVTILLRGSQN